jgi:hypothetical protein
LPHTAHRTHASSISAGLDRNALTAGRAAHAAGPAIVAAYVLSHVVCSTRLLKNIYGIDDNVCPRGDTARKGEAAVQRRRISRAQLALLERNEGLHANAIEHLPLFIGSVVSELQGVAA